MPFAPNRIPAPTAASVNAPLPISLRRLHSGRKARYFHARWIFLMEIFMPIHLQPQGHGTISAIQRTTGVTTVFCFILPIRTPGAYMTQGTVQLVAGILAVILIAIVIMRRKTNKKKDEDDF